MSKKKLLWGALVVLTPAVIYAANLSIPNTFTSGTTISSSLMNANFAAVQTAVNSKQDAITQTCASGQAVTAIGTNGTTGTATCSPVGSTINGTCTAGQSITGITNNVPTCAAPIVQSCMVPMPNTATVAGTNIIFPAATGNPATSCGQTHVTTGALPQNCLVTVNCWLGAAAVPAGGGVSLNIEESIGGGAPDCVNSCGTNNGCCNGWYQAFPALQGGATSATVTQQIVCPANTTCELGAIIFGAANSGATKAAQCQVSYFCIPT